MEISLKASGLMIKLMGMEFIFIKMELSMRETGKMISSMVMVKKSGPMAPNMKDTILRERSMEEVSTYGKMDLCTTEIGTRTELKDMESTNGKTAENT